MKALFDRLDRGDTLLLDGATGTELERRGARMDSTAWCALATVEAPDRLREVHEAYIRAGCDIITTNSFSSAGIVLEASGHGAGTAEINRRAVEIAKEARERTGSGRDIAIAGSVSTLIPEDWYKEGPLEPAPPGLDRAIASWREQAQILAEAGCDLILMEMMFLPERAVPAIEAAAATGLPVWVGLSCDLERDGRLTAHRRPDLTFDEAAARILEAEGIARGTDGERSVVGVMHSTTNATDPGLEALRRHWRGPLLAYPESGLFEMPHWQFVDIIEPNAFAEQAMGWVNQGVQVVGGCCGIGVDHIEALGRRLGRGG